MLFRALLNSEFQPFFRHKIPSGKGSIRVDFLAVTPFILNQLRVVLAIPGVLLFPERVHAASIFAIAMRVIDLYVAVFDLTPGQIWNRIR